MNSANLRECAPVDISDDDVMAAMKSMQGYIDITPAGAIPSFGFKMLLVMIRGE